MVILNMRVIPPNNEATKHTLQGVRASLTARKRATARLRGSHRLRGPQICASPLRGSHMARNVVLARLAKPMGGFADSCARGLSTHVRAAFAHMIHACMSY